MTAGSSGWRRWARIAAWCGASIAGVFVLFVAVANAMLAFGGIEAIVTRETAYTRVELTHGRAWVLWPTRVHVRDVSLRIDSYGYDLQVDLRHAVVDIRLLDLFGRRFRVEHLEGDGVDAKFRRKISTDEAGHPKLAAFPTIAGTAAEVRSGEPAPRKDRDDAWSIDLDDVDVHVDSLWVDEFATTPCGRIHGAFHWTAGYELEMPRTTVELVDASLWIGDHEALRGMQGTGNVELAAFDTGETSGEQVPGYLSFDVQLAARVHDPAAIGVYLPPGAADRIGHGRGPLTADLHAADGLFLPGSAVHYRTDRIDIAVADDASVRSAADILLEVTGAGRPRASIAVVDAHLLTDGRETGTVPEARASLTADHAAMTHRWTAVGGHLEVPDVRIDDLRAVSRLHPRDEFEFLGGSARGSVAGELDGDGAIALRSSSRMRKASMRIAKVRVTTSGTTRARVRFGSGEDTLVVDRVRVKLDDVAVTSPNGKSSDTRATIADAQVRVRGKRTTIHARGEVEDARPALVHFTRLDPLLRAIPDLERVQPVELEMRFGLRPRAVDIEVVRAQQLGLTMQGRWAARGDRSRGAFLFGGIAAVGFAVDDRGLREIVPAGRRWLDDRREWVRVVADAEISSSAAPAAGPRR
jgi:hypothetical protein